MLPLSVVFAELFNINELMEEQNNRIICCTRSNKSAVKNQNLLSHDLPDRMDTKVSYVKTL